MEYIEKDYDLELDEDKIENQVEIHKPTNLYQIEKRSACKSTYDDIIFENNNIQKTCTLDKLSLFIPIKDCEVFYNEKYFIEDNENPQTPLLTDAQWQEFLLKKFRSNRNITTDEAQTKLTVCSNTSRGWVNAQEIIQKCKSFKLNYPEIKENIGLNNLYFQKFGLHLSFSGKILAKDNNLGLIDKTNIREALQKLQDLGYVRFNIERVIQYAEVYSCDVTIDARIGEKDKKRTIQSLASILSLSSNKYLIQQYDTTGLIISKLSKNKGTAIVFYDKFNELNLKKHKKYREIIGQENLNNFRDILRTELHIKSYNDLRVIFKSSKKTGRVSLSEVLNYYENPIIERLEKLYLKEEKIFKAIQEFKDKQYISDEIKKIPIKITREKIQLIGFIKVYVDICNCNFNDFKRYFMTEISLNEQAYQKIASEIRSNAYEYLITYCPKATKTLINYLNHIKNVIDEGIDY